MVIDDKQLVSIKTKKFRKMNLRNFFVELDIISPFYL